MKYVYWLSTLWCAVFLLSSCHSDKTNQQVWIDSDWKLKKSGNTTWLQATVPGYVHLDLQQAGIIDSLYWAMNPRKYNDVGDTSWLYQTEFQVSHTQSSYVNKTIVFEGIDTYADVYLNDSLILVTDNMFLQYEANVAGVIKEGSNILRVKVKSPVRETRKIIQRYPFYSPEHANADANNIRKFARKAQYQFGWDWACPLIPSGIYRPVKLKFWDDFRITNVYIRQGSITTDKAILEADVEVESIVDKDATFQIKVAGMEKPVELSQAVEKGTKVYTIPFTIDNPRLWWPNGLGSQELYTITTSLKTDAQVTDSSSCRLGLRTIEFVNDFDQEGRSYYFKVNGVPVFMKGANYVPIDAMLPSVTPDRYKAMIDNCKQANMNMLRIWGGGIYENDVFYDLCDEAGILIYQDFMFASSMPPADEAFLDKVEREATYQVRRLRNHACMALWAGGNETESAYFEGFMPKEYPKEVYYKDHKKIFDELLPTVVKKHHPEISYVRSSPTTGTDSIVVNTPGYGDTHAWSVWFGKIDFNKAKTERLSRFISEYGFIGYPAYSSMQRYIPKNKMDTATDVFKFRDAYPGIQATIKDFIKRYYPAPANLEEFIYVSGLVQAEAMQVSNEIYRRNKPYCMGALLWQLNDVWPVASWSLVDYYGQWKPVMYRTRDSFAPVIVSVEQTADSLRVHGINDTQQAINATLHIEVVRFDGTITFTKAEPVTLKENANEKISRTSLRSLLLPEQFKNHVIKISLINQNNIIGSALHYAVRVNKLQLPKAKIELRWIEKEGKTAVELKSDVLAKNVYLIDAQGELHFEDNYMDLMPGIPHQIFIKQAGNPEEFRKRVSLFSLNEMVNR